MVGGTGAGPRQVRQTGLGLGQHPLGRLPSSQPHERRVDGHEERQDDDESAAQQADDQAGGVAAAHQASASTTAVP